MPELEGSLDVIVRDEEYGSSSAFSLLSANLDDGICSMRFGGILHARTIPAPITMRMHLSFIAHAQKRALEDDVDVEVHGLSLGLHVNDVLLREPFSVWDAELSNDERAVRTFALSDRIPPIAVVSMMALGAASLVRASGEGYNEDTEGGVQEGSEARFQMDRAIEAAGPLPPPDTWSWTMTYTAIASLEARLVVDTNCEIQFTTVDAPDPIMLWSDMLAQEDQDEL